jgi:hypothetical protein
MTVLGQPTIIINSPQLATDILSKKSAIYSSRPHLTMACELVGWKDVLVLLKYNDKFKACRRMLQGVIGTRASVEKFRDTLEEESALMLRRILNEPENFVGPVRKYVLRPNRGNPLVQIDLLIDGILGRLVSLSSGYLTDTGPKTRTTHWFALPTRQPTSLMSSSLPVSLPLTSFPSSVTSLNGSQVVASTRSHASGGNRYST